MILDKKLMFDDGTAAVAAESASFIDFKDARDIGAGEELYIGIVETTGAGVAADVDFTLEQAEDDAFTVNAEDVQLAGTMKAGEGFFAFRLQPFGITKRYVRLKYSAAGDTLKSFVVKDINAFRAYKSGFEVVS